MNSTDKPSSATAAPAEPGPGPQSIRRGLWAVIGAFAALALVYSIVVPPFETPDEIWHFAFIQHVAGGNGLPVSEANTQALWRQQGVQAPGYYLSAAALTAWIDQSDFPAIYARANPHRVIGRADVAENRNYLIHHREENWPWRGSILALHVARALSILLGALTLWAGFRAVEPVLGGTMALTGVAVFAFIPQFIFISAAASNDNAVNALAALVLWRLVILVVPDTHGAPAMTVRQMRRDFLLIGVLLGLAALSKLSALGLIALAGLAIILYAWQRRSIRPILESILWVGAPLIAIAGWWYVRNVQLYGDPLAWNIWEANILLRVQTATWRTIAAEFTSLEKSFWGLFGWLNVAYPEFVYMAARAVTLLIAVGWLLAAARWLAYSRRVDARWLGGLLMLLWLVVLALSWLRFMRIAPAAQGRYFFPAAPSLMLLIAIGLHAWRVWTLNWLIAGILFALSLLTPFWIIAPAYRPPTQAAQVETPASTFARVGDHFRLLSVEAEPDSLQPGQQATVRLLWQADRPPEKDYSVFVHLVDEDGLTVAQRDTLHGGGLYPSSQWAAGETRMEEYRVDIPATAYTPNQAGWQVGMYDASTGGRLPVSAAGDPSGTKRFELLDSAVGFGQVELRTPPGSLPNELDVRFGDSITLAGYELNRRRVAVGDQLEATLYWQARGPVQGDYTVFVHLLDAAHGMHGGDDDTPKPSTLQWSAGDIITDTHRFTVPESASPGIYSLEIGLYTQPGFDRLPLEDAAGAEGADRLLVGPIEVLAP